MLRMLWALHAQACTAVAGAEIDVSPVMGKGFSVEKAPPAEFPYLFIFATGTGIGPIKSLIESHALKVALGQFPSHNTFHASGGSLRLPCKMHSSMLRSGDADSWWQCR